MKALIARGRCVVYDSAMKMLVVKGLGAAALLALAACVPATPAARIEHSPEMYESLPAQHQEAVREGRIVRGMSYDGVLLAWGRPAQRVEQMRAEGPVIRWDYTGTRAVHTNRFYGFYGSDYYGRYGPYSRSAFGYGPQVAYVPYRRASVWFVDGKVDEWERMR